MSALHASAISGDIQRVRSLINRGVFIDTQTSDRWTALHRGVHSQREDVVRFLIDNGASCNIPNNLKQTPLHLAAMHDNVLIVLLLIEGYAEVDPKDVICVVSDRFLIPFRVSFFAMKFIHYVQNASPLCSGEWFSQYGQIPLLLWC
jgi:ankyrin repeat protein